MHFTTSFAFLALLLFSSLQATLAFRLPLDFLFKRASNDASSPQTQQVAFLVEDRGVQAQLEKLAGPFRSNLNAYRPSTHSRNGPSKALGNFVTNLLEISDPSTPGRISAFQLAHVAFTYIQLEQRDQLLIDDCLRDAAHHVALSATPETLPAVAGALEHVHSGLSFVSSPYLPKGIMRLFRRNSAILRRLESYRTHMGEQIEHRLQRGGNNPFIDGNGDRGINGENGEVSPFLPAGVGS